MRSALFLAIAALLAAAAAFALPPPAPTAPLRVGLIEWPGFYPLAMAAERGAPVELHVFPDNPTANDAFLHGTVDAIALPLFDAVGMASRGVDLRLIAALDHSDGADVLLGQPGLRREGLAGARIAFEGANTFSHQFVLHAVAQAGVAETAVRFHDRRAADVPAALAAGELDAGHSWGVDARAQLERGAVILFRAGDEPGLITEVLAAHAGLCATRGDDLRRLLAAIYAEVPRLRADQRLGMAAMARRLGRGADAVMAVHGEVRLYDADEARRHLTDPRDPLAVRRWAAATLAWLAGRGQIAERPDLDRLIDARFLP